MTSQAINIKEDANSIRRRQHDIDNIYNIQKRSQIHNKTTLRTFLLIIHGVLLTLNIYFVATTNISIFNYLILKLAEYEVVWMNIRN